jgi:signal peptidase I
MLAAMLNRLTWCAAVLALLAACGATGTTKTLTQPGVSMEPTIMAGQRITAREVKRGQYHAARGDIVVFTAPPGWGVDGLALKRVVAIGGERVGTAGGKVTVNGKPLDEPYVKDGVATAGSIPAITVPAGQIYLLGDNRAFSADSAALGPVPAADVTAVVRLD